MKRKTIVGVAGITTVWLLITFYMYYTRRENPPDTKSEKSEQKILKEYTGGHVLSQSQRETYEELTNKQVLTQNESKLLELLNEKFVWIVEDFYDIENEIKQKLDEEKVNFKIIGWNVRRVDEQTCLVSYTYEKSGKTLGWFFDVKSGGAVIRDVSSEPELMEKYNVNYREEINKKLREEKESKPTMSRLDKFKRLAKKRTLEKWIERQKRVLVLRQN
jgi:hypothetical protein